MAKIWYYNYRKRKEKNVMSEKDLTELKNKMQLIFTQEMVDRINFKKGNELRIDLHGLSVEQAKKSINNLIALTSKHTRIEVIHGYNHGTCIKEMIRNKERFNNKRVTKLESVNHNPGATILEIEER